jgi:hypothetical protein
VEAQNGLGVTQIRWRGIVLNTSVQAEKQGPSMTTRSLDCRSSENSRKYCRTSPPELDTILTSAKVGTVAIRDKKTANITSRTRIPLTN